MASRNTHYLEFKMDHADLQKALVGAAGMAIGAALVALLRVAAVDGAETARTQHLADVASGRTPTPRVVVRNELDCPNVAGNLPQTRVQ
jgi:hypothetical protein